MGQDDVNDDSCMFSHDDLGIGVFTRTILTQTRFCTTSRVKYGSAFSTVTGSKSQVELIMTRS